MATRARARAARPTAIVPRRGVGTAREGATDGRARAIARMSRIGARRGVRRARRRARRRSTNAVRPRGRRGESVECYHTNERLRRVFVR